MHRFIRTLYIAHLLAKKCKICLAPQSSWQLDGVLCTHMLSDSIDVISGYTEEPETKAKFQTSLTLPGCSSSLSLLGTGQCGAICLNTLLLLIPAGLWLVIVDHDALGHTNFVCCYIIRIQGKSLCNYWS